jgi:hypothetical protein
VKITSSHGLYATSGSAMMTVDVERLVWSAILGSAMTTDAVT